MAEILLNISLKLVLTPSSSLCISVMGQRDVGAFSPEHGLLDEDGVGMVLLDHVVQSHDSFWGHGACVPGEDRGDARDGRGDVLVCAGGGLVRVGRRWLRRRGLFRGGTGESGAGGQDFSDAVPGLTLGLGEGLGAAA